METSISLASMWPVANPSDYKAHLASWNGEAHPLHVFARDRSDWDRWQEYRSNKDDFNRPYIFSLMQFYPESDTWLFGGIYKVLSRAPSKRYEVELTTDHAEYIGRLKIKFKRPGRQRSVKLERYFSEMIVSGLLEEPYSGEPFPGCDNVRISFGALEAIVKSSKTDWKDALERIWGVYLITDKKNGKMYVGSAYGDFGVWSRWASYMDAGHGGNDELAKLIAKEGLPYARENFQFALLEHRTMRTDEQAVIDREAHWKEVLQTRTFGYNEN